MKYLLLFLLWGYNAGAQVVGEIIDTLDASKMVFIRPIGHDIIRFKSYAEQQAFYRNYGRFITGFDSSMLCKHIYVAVEPTSVKVPRGSVILQPIGGGDTKGKDIVCLKCHYVTNQIIEYTEPAQSPLPYGQGWPRITAEAFDNHHHVDPPKDSVVSYITNGPPGGTSEFRPPGNKKRLKSKGTKLNVCVSKQGYGCVTVNCPHQKKK